MRPVNQLSPALGMVLIASFALNCSAIGWGLPAFDPQGWTVDAIAPADVLAAIDARFAHGWYGKYPPLQYYLLALVYTPALSFFRPSSIEVSGSFYTLLFYAGRLVTVLMGTGTVFLVYRCGREIYQQRPSVLAAAITALTAPFVYYSKTTNLDVPYLFWVVLSLWAYTRILKYHRTRDYLVLSAAAVAAVCTKDQAYGFYVLTVPFVLLHRYWLWRKPDGTVTEPVGRGGIGWSILLGIGLFALLQNLPFNARGFLNHVKLIAGPASVHYRMFDPTPRGHVTMFLASLEHVKNALGWPLYIMCLLGLLQALLDRRKHGLLLALLVPGLSYYLSFISVVLYNFDRFLLPLALILAFFGGRFLSDCLDPARRAYGIRVMASSVILLYSLGYASSVDLAMVQDSRYYIERWTKQHIPASSLAMGVGPDNYLPRPQGFRWKATGFYLALALPEIERHEPEFLITSSGFDIRRFEPESPERRFLRSLENEQAGYRVLLRYRSRPTWDLLDHSGLYTYASRINPQITVYGSAR
jgi:hypothetical protein